MATPPLDPARARRIIDDLVTKHPVGARRQLRPSHYEKIKRYCNVYGIYRPSLVVSIEGRDAAGISELERKSFGYDPLELFKLGISGEDSARTCINKLYPGVTGPKLTRRARLLWERLELAYKHVMNEGTEGLWTVRSRHAPMDSVWNAGLPFWGATRSEAESQARMVGPMMDLDPEWRIIIEFRSLGTKEEAVAAAARFVQQKANRLRKEIANYQTALADLEKRLQEENEKAVKLLGGVMLLTPDDEQEQAQEAAQ